jgi:hypothetical protein
MAGYRHFASTAWPGPDNLAYGGVAGDFYTRLIGRADRSATRYGFPAHPVRPAAVQEEPMSTRVGSVMSLSDTRLAHPLGEIGALDVGVF